MSFASRATPVISEAGSRRQAAAIGPNLYDPSRAALAATAGRRQGRALAEAVKDLW